MNNELPEGGTLVKEISVKTRIGSSYSGWLIYEYEGDLIYRYDGKRNVVDHWIRKDAIYRKQVKGTSPFGVYAEIHTFPRGNLLYDTYFAMFTAMEDEIYMSEKAWQSQINYCSRRKLEDMSNLNKMYCIYSPYTYNQ